MTSTPAESAAELARAGRARDWHHAMQAAACDSIEPWQHGTVVRASRYPDCFDYNAVRVEREPDMGVDELTALADRALAGLRHRRVDFDVIAAAERLRTSFESEGWRSLRLLWMRHEAPPTGDAGAGTAARGTGDEGAGIPVQEVPYDAVHQLRLSWQSEDFPDIDPSAYLAQKRELALACSAQVLAVLDAGEPVAFSQLMRRGPAAEITHVYVHPDRRGAGLGTAITRAAVTRAVGVEDLWICADDEDRPKDLYARLGFRAAWTSMEFLRLPGAARWRPCRLGR